MPGTHHQVPELAEEQVQEVLGITVLSGQWVLDIVTGLHLLDLVEVAGNLHGYGFYERESSL